MSKIVYLAICASDLVSLVTFGAAVPSSMPASRPAVTPGETAHDCGLVWSGPSVSHTFEVMNSSSAPVEILRVVPSCGCTRVGEYPQRIEPGQPGGFTFSLNTQQIKGPFDKLVTIYTNDPKNPKIELHLKGECRHYVDLTPSFVAFGKITDQQPTFRTVEVRNNSQGPLRLELGASESGPFRFELSEVKPGDLYELRVTAMPPFPQGLLRGSATLKTNADAQKTVTVYASATVPERLEVQPQSILLPTAHASTRHASWSWPPRASRQR